MKYIDDDFVRKNRSIFHHKKAVFIVGAGISVPSGIPDFRSPTGIFAALRAQLKINGLDMFTYNFGVKEDTRPVYLKYMADLKRLCDSSIPNEMHSFLARYPRSRIYTQNIDGLEERAGVVFDKTEKTKGVYLHGSLEKLTCQYCGFKRKFTEEDIDQFSRAEDVVCDNCMEKREACARNNTRKRPVGVMHPDIIHYTQINPDGAFIGKMIERDRDCDLLIVVGTSLKVYGVKKMVKVFSKFPFVTGRRILVNLTKPTKEWTEVFDFMYEGDCIDFISALEDRESDKEAIKINGVDVNENAENTSNSNSRLNQDKKPTYLYYDKQTHDYSTNERKSKNENAFINSSSISETNTKGMVNNKSDLIERSNTSVSIKGVGNDKTKISSRSISNDTFKGGDNEMKEFLCEDGTKILLDTADSKFDNSGFNKDLDNELSNDDTAIKFEDKDKEESREKPIIHLIPNDEEIKNFDNCNKNEISNHIKESCLNENNTEISSKEHKEPKNDTETSICATEETDVEKSFRRMSISKDKRPSALENIDYLTNEENELDGLLESKLDEEPSELYSKIEILSKTFDDEETIKKPVLNEVLKSAQPTKIKEEHSSMDDFSNLKEQLFVDEEEPMHSENKTFKKPVVHLTPKKKTKKGRKH